MSLNLIFGNILFIGGVISGALVGLFFYKEEFMGGYNSFRRRLTRLGHISFFGIGILNILFSLSTQNIEMSDNLEYASYALVIAGITMPLVCFLTAFKLPFRHLFFIPVIATFIGISLFIKELL